MILLKNGKPRFKFYKANGALQTTIDLDLTLNPGGLWINYKKIFIEHNIIDYSDSEWSYGKPLTEKTPMGWDLFFTLNYDPYHNEDMTYKIGQIIDLHNYSGLRTVFYPRLDDTTFFMDVIDLNDDISLSLRNRRQNVGAYKGLVLNYKSKYPVKNLNFIKTTIPVYYGHLIPKAGQLQI